MLGEEVSRSQEKPIETSREHVESQALNIDTLNFENIARCYELRSVHFLLFERKLVLSPQVACERMEESRRSVEQMKVKPGDEWGENEKRKREREYIGKFEKNKDRIFRIRYFLKDAGYTQGFLDDEAVVEKYNAVLQSLFDRVYQAQLVGKADEELIALREAVNKVMRSARSGFSADEDDIKKVVEDINLFLPPVPNKWGRSPELVLLKRPALGESFLEFIHLSFPAVDLEDCQQDQVVYLEHIGTIGRCKIGQDGKRLLEVVMEHPRTVTGSGFRRPFLRLENVTGKVYPLTFAEGVPKEREERAAMFEAIPQALEARGVHNMKTHIFDATFLADALDSGAWSLPSLGGFQVETRTIHDGKVHEEFEYFRRNFPYNTFIFDGDLLEKAFPSTDAGNTMGPFHFIPGGLRFDHPAFLYCIVSPGIRTRLLNWIGTMDAARRMAIFGDKNVEEFFVSTPAELK